MLVDTALYGLTDAGERARRLQDLGFDGVFAFQGPHDVFVPLALAAAAVDIHVWSNVAIALSRNPVNLAHVARDIQALSGGNFTLGLGTQVRSHVERRFGEGFDQPVRRMADMVAALRAIFAAWETGEELSHRGPYYTHTLMTPMFNPGPSPWGPPPIHLGALGPRMTEMAASQADGLLVMPFTSRRFFQGHTLPAIERGVEHRRAGLAPLDVVPELILCTGRDDAEMAVAAQGCRALLGFYGSTPAYRPVLDAEGRGDLQPELRALGRTGQWAEMAELVDDELVEVIAVKGTPAEVAAQVAARYSEHARRVAVYLPYDVEDSLLGEVAEALHGV